MYCIYFIVKFDNEDARLSYKLSDYKHDGNRDDTTLTQINNKKYYNSQHSSN